MTTELKLTTPPAALLTVAELRARCEQIRKRLEIERRRDSQSRATAQWDHAYSIALYALKREGARR